MNAREAARLIDISAVRTHHTMSDIEEIVGYAKEYKFINVHVLPNWMKQLSEMLKDVEGVYAGGPVGFPSERINGDEGRRGEGTGSRTASRKWTS